LLVRQTGEERVESRSELELELELQSGFLNNFGIFDRLVYSFGPERKGADEAVGEGGSGRRRDAVDVCACEE
jgi:hypothetical protein